MQANGDPAGTVANTIAFSTFATIGLVVAILVYQPLFVGGTPRKNRRQSRTKTMIKIGSSQPTCLSNWDLCTYPLTGWLATLAL